MILSFVIPAWLSNFRRCNCSPFPARHGAFLTSASPNQLPHPYHLLSQSSDPLFSNSILLILRVSMYHLAVLGNELQDCKRYMLWEPMNHFQSLMCSHELFILIGSQLACWIQTQTLVQWDACHMPFLALFLSVMMTEMTEAVSKIQHLLRNPTIDAPHGLYLIIQLIRRSRHNRVGIDAWTYPFGWIVLGTSMA